MSLFNPAVPTPSTDVPPSPIAPGIHERENDAVNGASKFVDRRRERSGKAGGERRQFGSSHEGLSEAGRELAFAIDQYKLQHHRRYITCDEMLYVITNLGYSK